MFDLKTAIFEESDMETRTVLLFLEVPNIFSAPCMHSLGEWDHNCTELWVF